MRSRTNIDHHPKKPFEITFANDLAQEKVKRTRAENLNEAVLASIGDGVIIIDEYGIITEINKSASDILGYDKSELTGQWLQKVLPSKDIEGNDMPLEERPAMRAILSGHPASGVTSYLKKDGSVIQVAGTAAPFILEGKPRGTVIVFRDYTREVAASRAKDEFVSLASHQLRTPLTSIMMYAKLMRDYDAVISDKELSSFVRKIEGSATSMLELIDDFLNISKLELGRFEPELKVVDIQKLICDQVERLEPVIEENKISLKFSKAKSIEPLLADAHLMREVIHNLLTNAIRYRSDVSPSLHINVKDKTNAVLISIKDNGIGIPEDAQTHIFERLYRADNAKDVQVHGTGLGLYLVKKMVDSMGGKIWLTSDVGRGTTFYVQLPK